MVRTSFEEKVLVVAAHPNGQVLGCCGTTACHADLGDQLQMLISAEAATYRQQQLDRNHSTSDLSCWHRRLGSSM